MPSAPTRSARMVLTRRGRLLRTILVLITAIALVVAAVVGTQALGERETPSGSSSAGGDSTASAEPSPSDGGGEPIDEGSRVATPAPETDPEPAEDEQTEEPGEGLRTTNSGIIRSDTVGDGTWTVVPPVPPSGEPAETVHRYALRVEGGIGITPEEAAREVEAILADERGWISVHGVSFEQVADPQDAEFTISLASPPTVDELCLPARTHGIWSCRNESQVALNSDRWLHMTPTYQDLGEYRAYMVNHEVGHFLGHDHEDCGSSGMAAPVMMQQSKGLDGCRPNAWPTRDGAE